MSGILNVHINNNALTHYTIIMRSTIEIIWIWSRSSL